MHEPTPRPGLTLIGMPGAGKSTIARQLAPVLGFLYLDVDQWMTEHEGQLVPDLIDEHGRQYILDLEYQCIRQHHLSETIVATSGSIIYTPAQAELAQQTLICYLDAPLAAIEARIERDALPNRRIIDLDQHGLAALYQTRDLVYRSWANTIIVTAGQSVEETTQAVLRSYLDYYHDQATLFNL